VPASEQLRAQSLAVGAAGIALLHIEHAHRGSGSWTHVQTILASCSQNLIAEDTASLYLGAPAVAFALHTASAGTSRYRTALEAVDARITQLTRRRLRAAHARIDRGERPVTGEYDLFYGLTGLAVYQLRRHPHGELVHELLTYLTRLTQPLEGDHDERPGWWTSCGPSGTASPEFPGGHANLGMAHGIAGPLALLSLAARHGTVVDGQIAAIQRICAWLDRYRQHNQTSVWWPQWTTVADHRAHTINPPGPARPSWCYGTPGLARAQQLAGIVLGDTARQRMVEHALLACLSDPGQLARLNGPGLCHGVAGLLHTTHRISSDTDDERFAPHLAQLYAALRNHTPAVEGGFLDGTSGTSLALLAAEAGGTVVSEWDACLLTI
jgi:hypothetical protein